jgi:signal transduction histidine kinase/ligand-binding sensor domain-containing protein/DNA-binding response OmpR family regulator
MVCLLIQPAFKVSAQEYRFAHIDAAQGLSNNHVNTVYRDNAGFLWVGTASGLNRFDGYSMRVFRNEPTDSTSLLHDNVIRLFEIPGGKMGVVTANGICVYDPVTEKFSIDFRFLQKFSIHNPANLINIVHDRNDNYWFLMQNGGLVHYNKKSGKTISVQHVNHDTSSVSTNNITSLAQHTDGSYWIAHSNGIIEKAILTEQGIKVIKKLTFLYERMSDKEMALHWEIIIDSDGDLWIYSNYNKGVFYFNLRQGRTHQLGKNSPEVNISSDLIGGIAEDNRGHIWIGTHEGIDVVNKETLSVNTISRSSENENTLSQNSITTMFRDSDGMVWAGTYKGGLNYFHENIMRFALINRYSKPYGLPYEDVNSFVEDKKGNLWLGTNGGGLIYFNRQTGKYTTYRHDPKNPHSLSSDVIVSIFIDHEDKLWIGTFTGGLNCLDGQKFTRYQHDPSNVKSLPSESVWHIFEDSQQRLWIGTLDGGVNLFDRQRKTFIRYHDPDQRALRSDYIPTIVEDSEGNIWFGSSKGIDVLMKTTGKILHFESEKNNARTIGNNVIIDVIEDSKRRIWVGTTGGLSLWDKKRNRFINFTEKHGLPHKIIMSMLEDNDGRLWLGTPSGLSCATISTKDDSVLVSFRNYAEADGLQGMQFNENAALKTRSGELIFGGANGFNIFNPRDLSHNKIVPRLAFTDFQLFNRSIPIGPLSDERFTLPRSITTNPSIVLSKSDNVFSIEFAALNFIQPSKNQYKYKLEGFNNDWLSTDAKNRRVTFTNLNAGDYIFHVIASNNDGVWNEKGISLNITVLPPFWKSRTAYVIYMLFVLLLLFATRKVIQQREMMKFAIRQQTEEVKRSRELDMMKTKFFTNVSHELRTPLALILSPLEELRTQAVDPNQRKHFDLIQRNAKRLLNLVNQLLDFRKMEVQSIGFRPSSGDLIQFVRETVSSFSDISQKKDIRLTFESNASSFEACFDYDKIEKILLNLLSNAFKFTMGRGEISVTINVEDSSEENALVELRVKDTGIGIPSEKLELIFERYFQNDLPNSIMNQGSGIGLAITKEFVRIHGGTIRVESEIEKGSCFIVTLPLRKLVHVSQEPINEPGHRITNKNEIDVDTSKGKPLVLLVEDNEDFRFYLKDNLKTTYSVIEAATGDEGWKIALEQSPDLIVSDIMMPGMNGLELCKKLKTDQRVSHIPVILLTARSGEEQRLEGFEVGADDYIPKPFNFQVLVSRIRNLIMLRQNLHTLFANENGIKITELQITPVDQQFLQRFMQVIEMNIGNAELSVVEVSHELGVSRSQLFKKIQALTGKSPMELLRTIRLQHAAQLLEKSQLSVAEVAYKVGFNSPKYFARYFKERYHVVPSAYASSKLKL